MLILQACVNKHLAVNKPMTLVTASLNIYAEYLSVEVVLKSQSHDSEKVNKYVSYSMAMLVTGYQFA